MQPVLVLVHTQQHPHHVVVGLETEGDSQVHLPAEQQIEHCVFEFLLVHVDLDWSFFLLGVSHVKILEEILYILFFNFVLLFVSFDNPSYVLDNGVKLVVDVLAGFDFVDIQALKKLEDVLLVLVGKFAHSLNEFVAVPLFDEEFHQCNTLFVEGVLLLFLGGLQVEFVIEIVEFAVESALTRVFQEVRERI